MYADVKMSKYNIYGGKINLSYINEKDILYLMFNPNTGIKVIFIYK